MRALVFHRCSLFLFWELHFCDAPFPMMTSHHIMVVVVVVVVIMMIMMMMMMMMWRVPLDVAFLLHAGWHSQNSGDVHVMNPQKQ